MRITPVLLSALSILFGCATELARPAAPPPRPAARTSHLVTALSGGDAKTCRSHLAALTRTARIAGDPKSSSAADYVAQNLSKLGYEVNRHSYQVLVPTRQFVAVDLVKPMAYSASIHEPPIEVDLDTTDIVLPMPAVAFSPDGSITAECVFAGFGSRNDFEHLARIDAEVRDRICIARLGRTHPSSIAALAEEHGAAALLFYSDPGDDGFARGDVYPKGPFRALESCHRVTALRFFEQHGDPGTPHWASIEGAKQLPFEDMKSLPRIPLAVLSAADARPILENLRGPVVPARWQGALPITYHVGGTRHAVCHITTRSTLVLRPIEVIEASWPISDPSEAYIVVGADRDSLGSGASGGAGATTVLLDAARLVADRFQAGADFPRGIHFLSWDAGALGGIGVMEWSQQFTSDLRERCVGYIDIPQGAAGQELFIQRSPGLSTVASELSDLIGEQAAENRLWSSIACADLPRGPRSTLLTSFGIPTLSIASTGHCGLAGSLHDTLGAIRRHIDPGFIRHAGLAGIITAACYRLIEPATPPVHTGAIGWVVVDHCDDLEERYSELDLSALRDIGTRIGQTGDEIQKQLWNRQANRVETEGTHHALHQALALLQKRDALTGSGKNWLLDIDPDNAEFLRTMPTLERALLNGDRDLIQQSAEELLKTLLQFADVLSILADEL